MPVKHNAARRHRIRKMKFKVTNWRDYEAELRQRGTSGAFAHRLRQQSGTVGDHPKPDEHSR